MKRGITPLGISWRSCTTLSHVLFSLDKRSDFTSGFICLKEDNKDIGFPGFVAIWEGGSQMER
jgi:hypothetical protein